MGEGSKEERRESRIIRGFLVCMSEVNGDDLTREKKGEFQTKRLKFFLGQIFGGVILA